MRKVIHVQKCKAIARGRADHTIERLNREINGRTKAIGAFSDGQSIIC